MLKHLTLISLVAVAVGCSNDKDDSNGSPAPKVDTKAVATDQIQSQQWCMDRVGSHFTEETARISFDKSDLDESGKMKMKFDNLIKHNSGWASYAFGDKKYEWKLASGENPETLSLNTPYLSLITTGNTLGSDSYLEVTVESLGIFSAGGKTSSIFRSCPEDIASAKVSDKSDYALYVFQKQNFLRNEEGYVFWDLKFPTNKVKAAEVYNQMWCQSDRYLSYPYANSFKVLYFTEGGDMIHSRSDWNSDFKLYGEDVPFEVETNYVGQKYSIDESTGEMRIYEPAEEASGDYDFDVEFRTDGEKLLMITHDRQNQIFFSSGNNKPTSLYEGSVYYNCSAMKFENEYLWKKLSKIVEENITQKLTETPDHKSFRQLPYIN